MRHDFKAILLGLAMSTVSASIATAGTVTGSVSYLERIAAPQGAALEVQLLDVSRADAPSVVISAKRYALSGVPFFFELEYDDAIIDPRFTYTVSAKIVQDEQVLFRTTTSYPVITNETEQTTDIVLEKMSAPSIGLEGAIWDAISLNGHLIDSEVKPSLEFTSDGGFSAFGSCNNFVGMADISGGTLKFPANMAGTMMLCSQESDELERAFLDMLANVGGYEVDGNSLALVNEAGVAIAEFSTSL